MYQGKFDAKKKQTAFSSKELVAQRAEAFAQRKGKKTGSVQQAMPVLPAQKRGKASGLGGIVFYTVFFACVLVFYIGLYFGLGWLENWLTRFENAQPTAKSNQVFSEYFAQPDWETLYTMSTSNDGSTESMVTFVQYMQAHVQGKQLTFTETSAGLSGDKKYIVRAGEERIASFLLVDQSNTSSQTDIPDWQLGTIEFFIDSAATYEIQTLEGHTVTLNGKKMEADQIVKILTTKAQDYLPDGIQTKRRVTYQAEGLLVKPQVQVFDPSGKEVAVDYADSEKRFTAFSEDVSITAEEEELALNAAKAQCKYSITTKVGVSDLAKYFLRGTDTFASITSMDRRFLQEPQSYDFLNEAVTNMQRYSDSLYSVRVTMTMTQTRSSGTVKETQFDSSLFFEKQPSGKWLCSNMTGVDVAETEEQVRLTFLHNGSVLEDTFVASDAREVQCPVVTAPEGKTFAGWTVEHVDEAGKTVADLVFQPDAQGKAMIPSGAVLSPMVLQPLFE